MRKRENPKNVLSPFSLKGLIQRVHVQSRETNFVVYENAPYFLICFFFSSSVFVSLVNFNLST